MKAGQHLRPSPGSEVPRVPVHCVLGLVVDSYPCEAGRQKYQGRLSDWAFDRHLKEILRRNGVGGGGLWEEARPGSGQRGRCKEAGRGKTRDRSGLVSGTPASRAWKPLKVSD